MRQSKDWFTLPLGVGVDGVRLQVGMVAHQSVQDIDGLPHPAGDEATKQGNVGVGNMMVGDPSISAVADMPLSQQVVLHEFDMGTVDDSGFSLAPQERQFKAG